MELWCCVNPMSSMLSRECAIRMGTSRIILGATELAAVSDATLNNVVDPMDRAALSKIKFHLEAAAATAKALADSLQVKTKKTMDRRASAPPSD